MFVSPTLWNVLTEYFGVRFGQGVKFWTNFYVSFLVQESWDQRHAKVGMQWEQSTSLFRVGQAQTFRLAQELSSHPSPGWWDGIADPSAGQVGRIFPASFFPDQGSF